MHMRLLYIIAVVYILMALYGLPIEEIDEVVRHLISALQGL